VELHRTGSRLVRSAPRLRAAACAGSQPASLRVRLVIFDRVDLDGEDDDVRGDAPEIRDDATTRATIPAFARELQALVPGDDAGADSPEVRRLSADARMLAEYRDVHLDAVRVAGERFVRAHRIAAERRDRHALGCVCGNVHCARAARARRDSYENRPDHLPSVGDSKRTPRIVDARAALARCTRCYAACFAGSGSMFLRGMTSFAFVFVTSDTFVPTCASTVRSFSSSGENSSSYPAFASSLILTLTPFRNPLRVAPPMPVRDGV